MRKFLKPVLRGLVIFLFSGFLFLNFARPSHAQEKMCSEAGGQCYNAHTCYGIGRTPLNGRCGDANAICCSIAGPADDEELAETANTRAFTDPLGIQEVPEIKKLREAIIENDFKNNTNSIGGVLKDSTTTFAGLTVLEIEGGKPQKGVNGELEYSQGALGHISNYIAGIYGQPPATTERYVADVLQNLKINVATPAYAQGLGFSALEPILGAWKKFRNVAYLVLIVIMIVIGFMIMIRQKMGQAAVTAEQAIPNIVIALIAITFSYAIAGLLIDFMYLIMYLMVGLFDADNALISQNIFEIGWNFIIGDPEQNIFGNTYGAVQNFVTSSLYGGAGAELVGFLGGLTVAFVVAIALLISIFRLFFELLKTYVNIIFSIVLSPIELMLGALPGKATDVFMNWIKGLVGNLLAFPVVLILLIIYRAITDVSTAAVDGGFLPPYLIGRGNSAAIATMMGVAFLLIATDLVVEARKSMGAQSLFEKFGGAIAGAVKKGWTGDELVPGLGFSKIGGTQSLLKQTLQRPLWGTEETQKRAQEGKFNLITGVEGKGLRGAVENRLSPRLGLWGRRLRKRFTPQEPTPLQKAPDINQQRRAVDMEDI